MTSLRADIKVGDSLAPVRPGSISRTTLALFAGASGDHNPMHIDIDVAKSGGLDDVFAHGMLSMAYLGRVLTDWVAPEQLRSFRVRFGAITPLNAEPIAEATVVAIEDAGGERRAILDVSVTLADGTPTLTGTAVVAI